jgi:YbbR domain-containing protein
MISKEKKSNIFYGFVAFLFSLVLYFNANGQTVRSTLSGSESYEQTVTNVVIQPLYDTDKYYIHGFENAATVKLTSANRVQLNAEANADTRTFRVTADLKNLSEGTHEVALKVQNLSSAVTAKVEPSTITVTIEKKVTKVFDVEPVLTSQTTPSGFDIDSPTVSPKKVEITTGDKTLGEIDKVVAKVDGKSITDDDLNTEVAVQALNGAGEALSIVSDPVTVNVQAQVERPSKTVRLYGVQQGTPGDKVKSYDFRFSDIQAVVTGTNEQLANLESISVPIDISGITRQTTRTIEIPVEEGMSVSPQKVDVEITPVMETTSGTTTTRSGSDTGQTTDGTTTRAESTPASSEPSSDRQTTSTEETSQTTSSSETTDSTETTDTTSEGTSATN